MSQLNPIKVTLEKDKEYYWCACGKSITQPFCNGAHQGSGKSPLAFKAKESGDAHLCQCKLTGNAPYCDGSHKK